MNPSSLDEIFQAGGPLSRSLPGFVQRPQQVELAQRIAGFLEHGGILLAEAPTGVGKSLGYLFPSALWSLKTDSPVVISTHTKNLQDQLMQKDIPVVEAVLGSPIQVVVVKGRANYLCLRQLKKLRVEGGLLFDDERCPVEKLLRWARRTETGELSEFPFSADRRGQGLRSELCAAIGNCPPAECELERECFLTRLRERAASASLILVNHALLFSSLLSESEVLPEFSTLIADEGHHLDGALRDALSLQITNVELEEVVLELTALLNHIESLSRKHKTPDSAAPIVTELRRQVGELDRAGSLFFATIASALGSVEDRRLRYRSSQELQRFAEGSEAGYQVSLGACYASLLDLSDLFPPSFEPVRGHTPIFDLIARSKRVLDEIRANVRILTTADQNDRVYWIEQRSDRETSVRSSLLDVRESAREILFDALTTAIITSATLSTAEGFEHLISKLGLDVYGDDRLDSVSFSSPFAVEGRLACYCLTSMPHPGELGFAEAVAETLSAILRATGKSTLALFTSFKMMHEARALLEEGVGEPGFSVMAQGYDGEKEFLTREFAEGRCKLLMGTASFWEGVDFPGEQLEVLVLVRLPFSVPTDPLVSAIAEEIERKSGSPFRDFFLPAAQLRFKQGLGRLIRRETDRGVFVVLDPRIASSSYGVLFQRILPVPVRHMETREELVREISQFFKEGGG